MNEKKIHYAQLDKLFSILSNPLRRDIIFRIASSDWTIEELASHYKLPRSTLLEHLKQIQGGNLTFKHKKSRKHYFALDPQPLEKAIEVLRLYQTVWLGRFNHSTDGVNEKRN